MARNRLFKNDLPLKTGRERKTAKSGLAYQNQCQMAGLFAPAIDLGGVIFEPWGCSRAQNLYFNLVMLLVREIKWIDREKNKIKILSQLNRWYNINKLNQISVKNVLPIIYLRQVVPPIPKGKILRCCGSH